MKRYHIKVKEFRRLSERLPEPLRSRILSSLPKKPSVEVWEEENFKLYLVDGEPRLVETRDGVFFPPLICSSLVEPLPKVAVDRGAIPHICGGADVMRPGIVKVEGDFQVNALVVVVDEQYGKPLAIGLSLLPSCELLKAERGKMIKTVHHVNDKIWNLYRNL